MAIQLEIPESIAGAIRLPEAEIPHLVRVELAAALYGGGYLSLGKARELSTLDRREFQRLLGERGLTRHYSLEELDEDRVYGRQ